MHLAHFMLVPGFFLYFHPTVIWGLNDFYYGILVDNRTAEGWSEDSQCND